MKLQRIFIIIICIILSLLSGCGMAGSIYSNYRAIEDLRLIQTLGCDTAEGGGVALSASTGKQGESGSDKALLLRRDGESILQAMDSLQDYTTEGELYFAHVRHVLVGRDAAEKGVDELLDFVERDQSIRLDTELYILENKDAGGLIMGPGDDSYDVTEVLSSVRRDVELRAVSRVTTFRETAVSLSEYGAALVCLLRAADTEDSVNLETPGLTVIPAGYAILKDGRLAGSLTGEAAEAVSLLLGDPGTVARTVTDSKGDEVTLRFDGAGGGFRPSWGADGTPGPMEVRLSVRAVTAEAGGAETYSAQDGPYMEHLAAQLRDTLEQNIRDVLSVAQALNADFLSLGKELRLSGGEKFRSLPESWLTELRFNIKVEAVIGHAYDLDDPVRTDGGSAA